MNGEYTVLGFTGVRSFVADKGDTVKYAKVTLRDLENNVVEVKANVDFDFNKYLDKKVKLSFKLLKDSKVRCEGVQ